MLMNSAAETVTASRPERVRKGGFAAILKQMRTWSERRRSRHDLARLDERLLRDIGLTPGEALREAAVPFWKT